MISKTPNRLMGRDTQIKRAGMDKRVEFDQFSGDPSIQLTEQGLNKLASMPSEYLPKKIEEGIRWVKSAGLKDHVYFVVRAMGAGEYYGANNNGDYFPEAMLKRDHHTFEKHAKVYRQHLTSVPHIGDVLVADYNQPLHTVDLLLEIPMEKVADEVAQLGRGMFVETSMGCSVPYDRCSICGHKATKRPDYCEHMKLHMGRMLNGKAVYAINDEGVFKDISIVRLRAAPESAALASIGKIASMAKRASLPHNPELYIMPGEDRGAVREQVIQALSVVPLPVAIATLDRAVGPIRPDEFSALLHKDASLLMPGSIPITRAVPGVPGELKAQAHIKLASMVQRVQLEDPPEGAVWMPWCSQEDEDMYMTYRLAVTHGASGRRYLR